MEWMDGWMDEGEVKKVSKKDFEPYLELTPPPSLMRRRWINYFCMPNKMNRPRASQPGSIRPKKTHRRWSSISAWSPRRRACSLYTCKHPITKDRYSTVASSCVFWPGWPPRRASRSPGRLCRRTGRRCRSAGVFCPAEWRSTEWTAWPRPRSTTWPRCRCRPLPRCSRNCSLKRPPRTCWSGWGAARPIRVFRPRLRLKK